MALAILGGRVCRGAVRLRTRIAPPGAWDAHCISASTRHAVRMPEQEKRRMHSPRLATLGLSVALLGLLAHLALAGPADNVPSLVRAGTVITVDGNDQASLQLDDGTTFTEAGETWQ